MAADKFMRIGAVRIEPPVAGVGDGPAREAHGGANQRPASDELMIDRCGTNLGPLAVRIELTAERTNLWEDELATNQHGANRGPLAARMS